MPRVQRVQERRVIAQATRRLDRAVRRARWGAADWRGVDRRRQTRRDGDAQRATLGGKCVGASRSNRTRGVDQRGGDLSSDARVPREQAPRSALARDARRPPARSRPRAVPPSTCARPAAPALCRAGRGRSAAHHRRARAFEQLDGRRVSKHRERALRRALVACLGQRRGRSGPRRAGGARCVRGQARSPKRGARSSARANAPRAALAVAPGDSCSRPASRWNSAWEKEGTRRAGASTPAAPRRSRPNAQPSDGAAGRPPSELGVDFVAAHRAGLEQSTQLSGATRRDRRWIICACRWAAPRRGAWSRRTLARSRYISSTKSGLPWECAEEMGLRELVAAVPQPRRDESLVVLCRPPSASVVVRASPARGPLDSGRQLVLDVAERADDAARA